MTLLSPSASCSFRGSNAPCHKAERFPSGNPRRCSPSNECAVSTSVGLLRPRSEPDFPRHPDIQAVEFHDTGFAARIAIVSSSVATPAGDIDAELLLFHQDGGLRRVFPINGRTDGGNWDEAKELHLAPTLHIPSPIGILSARFLAVAFYPSGKLRSLTLWPRERLVVRTPAGAFWIRTGISFHENGAIASVEPHETVMVETPLGRLSAFDPNPLGVAGDRNSLAWNSEGGLQRIVTVVESFVCETGTGVEETWSPRFEPLNCDGGCGVSAALELTFQADHVQIDQGPRRRNYALANVALRPTRS